VGEDGSAAARLELSCVDILSSSTDRASRTHIVMPIECERDRRTSGCANRFRDRLE
jgi:hypothetical protein